MNSPEVRQLDALAELFSATMERCRPASVAILGIAGGNGLDHIDTNVTKRVVGFDLNPLYLEEAQKRYADRCNLELHCVDLAEERIEIEKVQLVHAALVFEHAGVDRCLENALSLVGDKGTLSVVLQLPSEVEERIGRSQFPSIHALRSHFSFIDPSWLRTELDKRGFKLMHEMQRSVPAGKCFWMALFGCTR